jgi:AcrR family transcriptional regulator
MSAVEAIPEAKPDARERILDTAYELFSRRAIRDVGIDEVVERAGVAKATLYRHFPSKDDLVIAFLERREERWTREWLQATVERRAETPAQRLLAIFDTFAEWFARDDFEGCSFINVMLEIDDLGSPVRRESVRQLSEIRGFIGGLAKDAGIDDVDGFARQWHILMKGCIVAAAEGDRLAAARARELGTLLLAHHGIEPR